MGCQNIATEKIELNERERNAFLCLHTTKKDQRQQVNVQCNKLAVQSAVEYSGDKWLCQKHNIDSFMIFFFWFFRLRCLASRWLFVHA